MSARAARSPEAAERAFADALLDPALPVPDGWVGANGADPTPRFAVYRNNVVVSLMAALADTYPVVRRVVGAATFDTLARWHVVAHPPRSAVLTDWGDAWPDALQAGLAAARDGAAPDDARRLPDAPWLPDLARLERARVQACHAADAEALPAAVLTQALADPARLPSARLGLHPSLRVLSSPHAVVSLWAAYQVALKDEIDHEGEDRMDAAPLPSTAEPRPESALVLRDAHDSVLVLPVSGPAAAFVDGLRRGLALGAAAERAAAQAATLAAAGSEDGAFDLAALLALLIRHGALCAWLADGDPPCAP